MKRRVRLMPASGTLDDPPHQMPLSVRVEATAGDDVLDLQGTIPYCTTTGIPVCRMQTVLVHQPVRVAAGGATQWSVSVAVDPAVQQRGF